MNSLSQNHLDVANHRYVGRFAPSPSGPLHFGSLVAAVGSYLQARAAKGDWLIRIEDIDTPRTVPGAADNIIRTLDEFGFEWSGVIEYQSRRTDLYSAALQRLMEANLTYQCVCSRAQISASQTQNHGDEVRYPGTCRHRQITGEGAVRFIAPNGLVTFEDKVQGHIEQNVAEAIGDFVVRRRDGLFTYQLAVVADDEAQGVTEVVRGADLLMSTPRQIALQRALDYRTPQYCHLPLAVDAEQRKLSKSAQSIAIDSTHANVCLWAALNFMRQSPPTELKSASLSQIWAWALANWTLSPIAGVQSLPAPATEQ